MVDGSRENDDLLVAGPGESDRALIILDMTLGHFRGDTAIDGAPGIVRYIQGELRYFRERGRMVVFASDDDTQAVIQELTPRSDELTIVKSAPSAFYSSGLDEALRRRRVRRVTLVGMETHTGVLLTAADALSRGYEVVVPDPCVCAREPGAHAAAIALLRRFWPASWSSGLRGALPPEDQAAPDQPV